MKKFFTIIFMICFSVISFSKDALYVGTNAEFQPFEYIKNGEIVGFDIDLINAVGKKIGREIKIKNMSFDGLIPALQTNKLDIIIAGMTITPERDKFVDFSNTYFKATQVLIVKENTTDITNLNSLKNKKVGVALGFTGDVMLSKMEGINKTQYNSIPSMIMALKSNKIDAVVLDSVPAENYVAKNKGLKVIKFVADVEEYAIAIKKGNTELVQQINKALEEIHAEGIYDEIIQKNFQ